MEGGSMIWWRGPRTLAVGVVVAAVLASASWLLAAEGSDERVSLDERGGLHVPKSQEAMWIWAAGQDPAAAPLGSVFFRKSFEVKAPAQGRLEMTADDTFEVFVNGREVGTSGKAKELHRFDISKFLSRGNNLVAIKVTNVEGKSAGLAARLFVQEGSTWRNFSTNDAWRSTVRTFGPWNTPLFSDRGWGTSRIIGRLVVNDNEPPAEEEPSTPDLPARPSELAGSPSEDKPASKPPNPLARDLASDKDPPATTPPTSRPETPGETLSELPSESPPATAAAGETPGEGAIKVAEEFRLDRLLPDEDFGSLIALAFNEFGQLILSAENGPLLLAFDSDSDGQFDKVRPWCTEVKNVQGILPLNGEVYVTGEGPQGTALYRLADADRNGSLEIAATLVKFKGEPGEHSAHGLALGPDGLIYCVLGNYAQVEAEPAATSPYTQAYEGDLAPRYEDPTGHAAGIKAPGGSIFRVSPGGEAVELVAGGLRNAYDLAFNREGELFTYDSDHEADEGAPWYRSTRLYHVIGGADFGWRSGWAPRPDHFLDNLPPVLEAGRASPTGMTFYCHNAFPVRYQNALFVGDWSQGRILAHTLERKGAGYQASTRTFVEGEALSVTDLEVSPDGALYFVTGGRGAAGALYRVAWKGIVPEEFRELGTGITAAVRQPQLQAAWARQEIARVQQAIDAEWDRQVQGVAKSSENPSYYRRRALYLMQLFGPEPDPAILLRMTHDADVEVRAAATEALARVPLELRAERLPALLEDPHPLVRRVACEALQRSGGQVAAAKLAPLLASSDRYECLAARNLLVRLPVAEWRQELLAHENPRVVAQAIVALMVAEPNRANGLAAVDAMLRKLAGFVSDEAYLDLMRAAQVAIHRAGLKPDELSALREILVSEYPTENVTMNNELVRLLAFLQAPAMLDRGFERLASSTVSEEEKLHLAVHLRFFSDHLRPEQKLDLLGRYEGWATKAPSGYARYLPNLTIDLARTCSPGECRQVLARGVEWPSAALGALYQIPPQLDAETLGEVSSLERQLDGRTDGPARRLQTGLAAVLARSGDEASLALLREIFDRDPERRSIVMVGLAQSPAGANWEYLIRGLSSVEGPAAKEVFERLAGVQRAATEAESYRTVIIRSLALGKEGAQAGTALLEHWSGEKLTPAEAENAAALVAPWQDWYAQKFPEAPAALLPEPSHEQIWTVGGLIAQLHDSTTPAGNAERGRLVFERAQCAKCHKHGALGESLGPDLTTVAKRFSTKEVIESLLYPSAVISSQYAAKTVTTVDGRSLTGLVAPGAAGETVVIDHTGQKITLRADEIEAQAPASVSAMPEGLLNELSLAEIQDLLTFLRASPGSALTRQGGGNLK